MPAPSRAATAVQLCCHWSQPKLGPGQSPHAPEDPLQWPQSPTGTPGNKELVPSRVGRDAAQECAPLRPEQGGLTSRGARSTTVTPRSETQITRKILINKLEGIKNIWGKKCSGRCRRPAVHSLRL